MIFICPSCGIRLEKEFKFCPNCGFDLSAPEESRDSSNGSNPNKVICKTCGEENDKTNDFCTSCGSRLTKDAGSSKAPEKKSPATQARKQALPKEKGRLHQPAAQSKSLSTKSIITITVVALALILIILAASGVFNSTPVPATVANQQTAPQSGQSGVDLAALEEINKMEEQVKANPNDIQSLLHLAHMKNDAGLPEKAIENYRQYLEKNPADADARVDMGVCYFNLKDYSTAIAEMKKALEYKPKHQIAHLNLGIVNLTAGNLEESKTWFKKAADIDPTSEVGKRAQDLLKSHN